MLRTSAALQLDDPEAACASLTSWRADVVTVACSDPRMSSATLTAIVDEVHERGLRVLAHVHTDEDALAAVAGGVDGVEPLPAGRRLAEALDALAEADVVWTPTLAVMEALANADRPVEDLTEAYPGLPDRLRPTERALGVAPSERIRRRAELARRILRAVLDGPVARGVRVAAGTDAGNNHTPHGWSLHRELRLLRRAGLDAAQVLAAATDVAAAKPAGPDPDFGRVAAGVHADVLVLAEDPRRSTDALARPKLVIAAGPPAPG